MRAFTYERVDGVADALAALASPGSRLLAGGTELLNWLREGVESPERVVDITALPLDGIELRSDGLRLGALARLSDVAAHDDVVARYPVIAESLLQAASPQLRNMATVGGNLMQRTRCPYFRADVLMACNRRVPGSGCAALEGGDTSSHSIFGWTACCAATHPSDLAVALACLDASIVVDSVRGQRRLDATCFHRLPGGELDRLTELLPDELVTAVEVPDPPSARQSHYLKVRQRSSYEFAVVSAAACVELQDDTITSARVALGGVAPRPWRLPDAESALSGVSIHDLGGLGAAVARSFVDANPLKDNEFKVELAQRAAVRAIRAAGARR